MTTYQTNNPLGSKDPRDLYDNAENFDAAMNSEAASFDDRFGKPRMTWSEAERRANLQIDRAEQAAYDAISAASAIGPIKFYSTKSDAEEDLANIPEGSQVEIARDEDNRGSRTRYKKESGNLVFELDLDQLRFDLVNPVGNEPAGGFFGYSALRNSTDSFLTCKVYLDGVSPIIFIRVADAGQVDNGGTIIRRADNLLYEAANKSTVTLRQFGAIPDPDVDSTDAIQRALSSGATVINGEGLEYGATELIPDSQTIICNFKIKRISSAVEVSLQPLFDIAGQNGARDGIAFLSVKVNGNRQNLASINTALGEDGGMHGFRIGLDASNISIIDCDAKYCGTAGLAIHSGDGTTADGADYRIKNIYIRNFTAEWNREHGMFGDGFDGVTIEGAKLNNNGQDLNTTDPLTHGNRAFRHEGLRFGSGFDLETYSNFPLSFFKNFKATGIESKGNATQNMIYCPNALDAYALATPAVGIEINDFHMEAGNNGGPVVSGMSVYANNQVSGRYGVRNLFLSGYLEGHLDANNVDTISYTSGFIRDIGQGFKAKIENSINVNVTVPGASPFVKSETIGSLVITKISGAGTLSATLSPLIQSQGSKRVTIDLSISGGTISGGAMCWKIDLPLTFTALTADVSLRDSISFKTTSASVIIEGQSVFLFVTPIDMLLTGVIVLEIA